MTNDNRNPEIDVLKEKLRQQPVEELQMIKISCEYNIGKARSKIHSRYIEIGELQQLLAHSMIELQAVSEILEVAGKIKEKNEN